MEAVSRQPAMLQGLSRFLVEHERCGAGFDVSHPAGLGSGRVSIVCRGCGARHDYATATIEFEREIEFAPVTLEPSRAMTPAPSPPPRYVERREPSERVPTLLPPLDAEPDAWEPPTLRADRSPPDALPRRGSWTRDRLITAGLLVFAAAALVFAVVRISNDVGKSSGTSAPTPAPSATAPKAVGAPRVRPAPIAPPPAQVKKPQSPAPSPPIRVKTVTTARFALTVPTTWAQQNSGGGVLLAPPGSSPVSVQVFYEDDPGLTMQRMATETAAYLRSRDSGADVSGAEALRVAGNPSFKLRANGSAGSQTALGVLAGPYRYLVVESADPGAPKSLRAKADRALASFTPR